MREKNPTYVYLMSANACGPVKVGVSLNPWARLSELQCGNPAKLVLRDWWKMPTRSDAFQAEDAFLTFYCAQRASGEWINVDLFTASVRMQVILERLHS